MSTRYIKAAVIVLFLLIVYGCSGTQDSTREQAPEPLPLRVGISPDYPPLIFMIDGKVTGLESDLAQRVARSLQRPLTFVPMKFENLIPGLLEGKIDIIMSGMTVTPPRTMQVDFTDTYFRGGLLACMRSDEQKMYTSLEQIRNTPGNVGVIPGTSADAYVTRHFPTARKVAVAKAEHAAMELKTKKIDLFVADGPAVVWLVSRNEADLAGFWKPLIRENFAWGVLRGNSELLTAVNALLARWKKDGTLRSVLLSWLPYLDRIQ